MYAMLPKNFAHGYIYNAAYGSGSSSGSDSDDKDVAAADKHASGDSSNSDSSDSESGESDSSGEVEAKSKQPASKSTLPSALGLFNSVKKPDYLVTKEKGAVEVQEFNLAAQKKKEEEEARIRAASEAAAESERAAARAAAAQKQKTLQAMAEKHARKTGVKSKRDMTAKVWFWMIETNCAAVEANTETLHWDGRGL